MNHTKIPQPDSIEELTQFWNTHDLTDFEDELEEGQMVYVKLLAVDDRGKCKLSMKRVDQETGEEIKKDDEEAA